MAGAFSLLRVQVVFGLVCEALGRRLRCTPSKPKVAVTMVQSSARRSSGRARQPRARQAGR